MPKKGYKTITVTDKLHALLKEEAKVKELSVPGAIQVMLAGDWKKKAEKMNELIELLKGRDNPDEVDQCILEIKEQFILEAETKMGQCSNCGAWLVSVKGELVCPKKCREVKS